jgi:FtsH-binding integral membrane protein
LKKKIVKIILSSFNSTKRISKFISHFYSKQNSLSHFKIKNILIKMEAAYDGFGENILSFSEAKIRHGFIRKVYSIVSLQLLITTAIVSLVIFNSNIKLFFYTHSWIVWLLVFASFIPILILTCVPNVTRSFPLNLILLAIFTVIEAFLLGVISSAYDTNSVFIAVVLTALVVISLTLFAFQTKYDFTGAGVYLFVFLIVLLFFGIVCLIVRSRILEIFYAASGALLFSFYIVFDTQLMIGGNQIK